MAKKDGFPVFSMPSFIERRSLGLGTSYGHSIVPEILNFDFRKTLYQKDIKGHYGCVNAIEFSHNEQFVVSGGDDRRIILWSVSDLITDSAPKPIGIMRKKHSDNIFAYAFNLDDTEIYSGCNDGRLLAHDISTGTRKWSAYEMATIQDIDVNRNSGELVVVRACKNAAVTFYDTREGKRSNGRLALRDREVYSGQFNPVASHFIAISSYNDGVMLFDRRNMKRIFMDLSNSCDRRSMYARWNRNGTKIAHLVSTGLPHIINFKDNIVYQVRSDTYSNRKTVKSIDWIDDDIFVTGSDTFDLYAWNTSVVSCVSSNRSKYLQSYLSDKELRQPRKIKISSDVNIDPIVLKGHRSVCNQVRYSDINRIMISSGVEKIVKVWTPYPTYGSTDKPRLREKGTMRTIGEEGEHEVKKSRTEESRQMLLHFDQVIDEPDLASGDEIRDELDDLDSTYFDDNDEDLDVTSSIDDMRMESDSNDDDEDEDIDVEGEDHFDLPWIHHEDEEEEDDDDDEVEDDEGSNGELSSHTGQESLSSNSRLVAINNAIMAHLADSDDDDIMMVQSPRSRSSSSNQSTDSESIDDMEEVFHPNEHHPQWIEGDHPQHIHIPVNFDSDNDNDDINDNE